MEDVLSLPKELGLPSDYVVDFNSKLHNILVDGRFEEIMDSYVNCCPTMRHLVRCLFRAVCGLDLEHCYISLNNFKTALTSVQRQPKMEALRDCSIVELYILVSMKRLEVKEQKSYSFIAVVKEYKSIHDSFQTSDYYGQNDCLRAFEQLVQRGADLLYKWEGRTQSGYRISSSEAPLLSIAELSPGLKAYHSCPAILLKLVA